MARNDTTALAAALYQAQQEILAMRKSTSWRVTLPVRVAKRFIADPRGTSKLVRDQLLRRSTKDVEEPLKHNETAESVRYRLTDFIVVPPEGHSKGHILIGFLGFRIGGGEVFPIQLANMLKAKGYFVSMVGLKMDKGSRGMVEMLDPSIPVYESAYVKAVGVERFLAEAEVSLIHSHMTYIEHFFFDQCQMTSYIPYIVTLHGSLNAATNSGKISCDRLWKWSRRVNRWVYTADRNLEPFGAFPLPDNFFLKLPNAVAADGLPFPKTRAELGIAEDAIVFTLVARGIKSKGWLETITAFIKLRAHAQVPIHLLLCGEGPEKTLHYEIRHDDPDITFLNHQVRIEGLYRLSDVALVPTRFDGESYPLIIIHAFLAGTPVIASDIGEIRSIVSPKGKKPGGLLIEPNEKTELFIADLHDAMEATLSSVTRKKLQAGAKALAAQFSMEKMTQSYIDVYEDLLSEVRAKSETTHARDTG